MIVKADAACCVPDQPAVSDQRSEDSGDKDAQQHHDGDAEDQVRDALAARMSLNARGRP